MIETDLYSVLSSATQITTITGTNIYPVVLPINTTATALTYRIVGTITDPTLDTSGLVKARVQIDCWAADYNDAVTLRAAVISVLNGYENAATFAAQLLNQSDSFAQDLLRYIATVEFFVLYDL
ncbi:oligoribonuclease NrnB/cAMP/cGMP phosphodiesterase (DHH superfamily) [Silvibacterium bohemicum]|uniref:Oligoribonuclease NrnB/cAMP/cGMP phosphodiesterase (DHH superfamily) n=1 Tax=Silvibacterium bohemicum TaxID=1577686 RepID=A0A841JYB3_9BACT|nr:DUF3168 domain-containing protein [Silvibacterium bohemicum]MBB6144719.1 oligoribonuclease NrnB/cAMP/cGMP phosphodiesterase (DHH superfamily) [Silvibacterium bohemicum]